MCFSASEANSGAVFPSLHEPNGPGENSESTQPSPLLFGKSPGPDLDAFEGVFGRAAALEVIHNLPVAKGFPGLATQAIGVVQGPHFIDEAIGGHGLHACVDAAVDGLHGPIEADGHKIFARRTVPGAGGGAAAFGGGSLQGSDGAAAIVGMDAVGVFGASCSNLERRSASDMASNAARKAGSVARGHPFRRASSARTGWSLQPRWAIVRFLEWRRSGSRQLPANRRR